MRIDPTGSAVSHSYTGSTPASADGSASFGSTLQSAQNASAWQTALAGHSAAPRLVNVDAAMAGGLEDMQTRLKALLVERGLDPNAQFQLSYDAANQSFRVAASPEIKAALESELNKEPPTAAAAAIRKGYQTLDDIASSAAAVRAIYARDHGAQRPGPALGRGFAYHFDLTMQMGKLSYDLIPI